jgi:uncharacterized damage-inducible protein DinB
MREVDRISDQLARAFNGDPWHGPSLRAALDGVDNRAAISRPLPQAHTICELVLHLTAWTREVTRRLHLGIAQDPEDGDWPSATPTNEVDWQQMLSALDDAQRALVDAVESLSDAELDTRIGDVRDRALGTGVSRYVTLHGVVQHYAYHAGQIAVLTKLV